MSLLKSFFDDVVSDEDGVWSNVCSDCVDHFEIDEEMLSDNAVTMVCGVDGCCNDADYHIDFGIGE